MRATTAPELAVLAANSRVVTWRVKVENGSGTMKDLSTWVDHVTWDLDIDQPVSGASVYFVRADGATQSLSPLRTDSTLNLKDDLVTVSAQLDIGRKLTIEVATTAVGVAIVAGDYKLMFSGVIDSVNFEDNPIGVVCRDDGGLLVDRWVGANWTLYQAGTGTVTASFGTVTFSTSQAGLLANGDTIVVSGNEYVISSFNGTTTAIITPGRTFTASSFQIGRPAYQTYKVYGSTTGIGTVLAFSGTATFSTSQAGHLANGDTIIVNGVEYVISSFSGTTSASLIPGGKTFPASPFEIDGKALETVMQEILTDAVNAGPVPIAVTLNTPVSPGFIVTQYKQENQSVMEALQALAGVVGWDVRYLYDSASGTFKLTLWEPDRAKTTPDYTFGPSQYFAVTRLNLDRTNVRNNISIQFFSSDSKRRIELVVNDSASYTKYGLRYMQIVEPDNSPINTLVEASNLANAVLADLKEPKAEQEINLPFFWPAELGDLYRHSANLVHYNGNQDFAVVRIEHELSPGHHRTTLKTRGSVAGANVNHFRPRAPKSSPDFPRLLDPNGGVIVNTDDSTVTAQKVHGTGAVPALSSPQGFWNGTNSVEGTDTAGRVTLSHTTAAPLGQVSGHQIKVTFSEPYDSPPFVVLSPVLYGADGHYTVGTVTVNDFWIDSEGATIIFAAGSPNRSDVIPYAVIG